MANRIRFTTAEQVVEAFPAAAEDLGDIPAGADPLDFLSQLASSENPIPALFFAGWALPKRESVWWACLVMRGMGLTDGEAGVGLGLAEAWVRNPEEDERRAAGQFAEEVYFEGPGAWAAFAAFTTAGSLAPAGLQAVPPPPELSGKCAGMCAINATESEDPMDRLANIQAAIACAREFAEGGDGTKAWQDHKAGKFHLEPAAAE